MYKPEAEGAQKLTERQGKAYAWNESFTLGASQIEKLLEVDYRPSAWALGKYAIFKDEKTGPTMRTLAREQISVDDMLWFNAAYRMIEPAIRQSSGAAIKASEIENAFNAMIPLTKDEREVTSKKLYRDAIHRGIKLEMQGGAPPGKVATPTGRTATNAAGKKVREMSDGSWQPIQ